MGIIQRAKRLRSIRIGLSSSEVKFVGLLSMLLLAATTIPYAYGYTITPGEKWFSGIAVNVHDAAQYFSWIREAGQGMLTENKLTSEPSNTVFFNLHWWLAGRTAALFGFSMPQIYQIYRVLAGILLIAVIYVFSALIFKHQAKRRFSISRR